MTAIETAHDAYLRLREDWQCLLDEPAAPMRSSRKDALFAELGHAWARMTPVERKCAGFHCVVTYH